jgi:lipopolysaccharide transport system permease protein
MSSSTSEVHYRPNQRATESWFTAWKTMVKDCIASRDLIFQLFRRDYVMMYKKSFLGMGWHLAAPIMGILSWVMMNSTGILDPGDVGIPYPAYVLISTTIWGFFMQTFNNMSKVLEIAQGFVMQVGFPHHVLIVKQWLETGASFLLSLIVLVVGVVFLGVVPAPAAVLFPLALLPILLLGTSIGLVVAVVKIVSPDIQKAIMFLMGFWMYLTPVVFSPNIDSPLMQTIMQWNPMTHLLVGARELFIYGTITNLSIYLMVSLATVVTFMIVWRVFYVTEQKVIEKMI